MKFKNRNDLKLKNGVTYSETYQKPMDCPYCERAIEATIISSQILPYESGKRAGIVSFKCPSCGRCFLGVYILVDKVLEFNSIVPIADEEALHEGLEKISPRFADLHQQAFRAEVRGDYELAIIGYRTALEIAVKDFAIKVLRHDPNEVKAMSLADAITSYVPDEITKAADVVRIVGNSHVHYVIKYPEISFDIFKHYYNITLKYLGVKYDADNPPVTRR